MKELFLLFFIAFSFHGFAQKIKLVEGSDSALKGQHSINLEFTYDGITIGKQMLNEKEYIDKKKGEYNAKEPGKGDTWEMKWYADRKDRFEPRFVGSFSSAGMSVKQDAEFTIIFNTTTIEPGYNIGGLALGWTPTHRNAYIDGVAVLVATSDKSKVIARWTIDNAPGNGVADWDTGFRIQESYATAGQRLGRLIAKDLGK